MVRSAVVIDLLVRDLEHRIKRGKVRGNMEVYSFSLPFTPHLKRDGRGNCARRCSVWVQCGVVVEFGTQDRSKQAWFTDGTREKRLMETAPFVWSSRLVVVVWSAWCCS